MAKINGGYMKKLFYIFFFTVVFSSSVLGQSLELNFERISLEQGLSQSSVNSIYQDRQGFMWFGTNDGLNRYDGYNFAVFRNDPRNPNSLSGSVILKVIEDSEGLIWTITGLNKGLNKYNPRTGKFTRYQLLLEDSKSENASYRQGLDIIEDSTKNIWIATDFGVARYDRKTDKFVYYNPDKMHSSVTTMTAVRSLYKDRANTLWLILDKGISKYIPETDSFTYITNERFDKDFFAKHLYQDKAGKFWLDDSNKIFSFDEKAEKFLEFYEIPKANSLSNLTEVTKEDIGDCLWMISDQGILLFNTITKKFTLYQNDKTNPNSLSHNNVLAIFQDNVGTFWIGTGLGINKYNPNGQQFVSYRLEKNTAKNRQPFSYFYRIFQDSRGEVWVVGDEQKINKFDPLTKTITAKLNETKELEQFLQDVSIFSIFEDSRGVLWFSTDEKGLYAYDLKTLKTKIYLLDPSYIEVNQDFTYTKSFISYEKTNPLPKDLNSFGFGEIYQDTLGDIWAVIQGNHQKIGEAYTGQTYLYDKDTENFFLKEPTKEVSTIFGAEIHRKPSTLQNSQLYKIPVEEISLVQKEIKAKTSVSLKEIQSFCKDNQGIIWVGTYGSGLYGYNPANKRLITITEKDGLPNNVVYGILKDKSGYLWLSTNQGIAKFNPQTLTFRNYTVIDGLQSNEFNSRAYFQSRTGEMFFAGVNGLNRFYPEQIKDASIAPPIVITTFKINDKVTPVSEKVAVNSWYKEQLDKVNLSYLENYVSFDFAALNFNHPEKNQYSYKLEGLEEKWSEAGFRRYVNYTNLAPGDYTFRVKGSNNNGVWNEVGAAIQIHIDPPPWKTWWAYLLYFMVAITSIITFYSFRIKKIQEQVKLEKAQYRAEAAETANEAKSTFLANMSHELRTPLNSVIGFSQLLIRDKTLSERHREQISIIAVCGETLLSLINDVLSIAKIEAGKTTLNQEVFSLTQLINQLEEMFIFQAEGKNLAFICEFSKDLPKQVIGDLNKLRQILMNLISNAIKFTTSGKIVFRASWQNGKAVFQVEDTGYGISQEELKLLFKPLTQTESGRKAKQGTGLGLAISRAFAELMGGDITVSSQLNRGSCFTCSVKLELTDKVSTFSGKKIMKLESNQGAPRILIVDDRWENRAFLAELLSQIGFTVNEAKNGLDAIEVWEQWRPHLIFMDMRMPVLDGLEATKRIRLKEEIKKNNSLEKTFSPVVIIGLSASVYEKDQNKITSAGCDDFLPKPFSETVLLEKIASYLKVKYIYQENEKELTKLSISNSNDQNREDFLIEEIKVLPNDIIEDLHLAASIGDVRAANAVLDKIQVENQEVVFLLRNMIDNYLFAELLELLNLKLSQTPVGIISSYDKQKFINKAPTK